MMNAHASQTNHRSQEPTRYTLEQRSPDESLSTREENIAYLKAQLIARSDGEARIARVEMLKAQIEAGSYSVDAEALARKMLTMPAVHAAHLQCSRHGKTGKDEVGG